MKRVKASRVIVSIAAVVWIAAWSPVGSAQATNGNSSPAIGTWKLNLAKSKYDPGPAPKSQTMTIEASGTDGQKTTVEGVAGDGSRVAYSVTAKFDGKDYSYAGVGTPNGADAVALKRIDAYTFENTTKKAGRIVGTARMVYSKDGNTRTVTAKGTTASGQPANNVIVYDRQ